MSQTIRFWSVHPPCWYQTYLLLVLVGEARKAWMSVGWPLEQEGSIWGSSSGISKIWHNSLYSTTFWQNMHHVTKMRLCWKINMKTKYCKYNTYLFFTDLMVDLVLKSLFDPSKRHVPVIFGNILTEAERRERMRERKNLNPFSLPHH